MKNLAVAASAALSIAAFAIAGSAQAEDQHAKHTLVKHAGKQVKLSQTKAPENAKVYFISPTDGATVGKKVKIVFGLENMGVAPAGFDKKNTGHHHLLIDTDEMPNLTMPLPATDKIKHFGGGQTETEITLAPGKHTLQLVLGDHLHIPHEKPVMSKKITVHVK